MKRSASLSTALLLLCGLSVRAEEPTYEKHVRPILKAYCFECHGEGAKLKGGLDLRLTRLLLKGGDSGAAIKPGKSKDSLLTERVNSGEMPPGKKKLTAAEIALLTRWIDGGAKAISAEPEKIATGFHISDEDRKFWAYQPVKSPFFPQIRNPKSEIRNPIDLFIVSRLQTAGLTPSPEADRQTLVRRLTFDLTGLPPTPDEVEAARIDKQADWYERVVDRLLASPAYGERWGRHWLDIAGYADSDGYTSEDRVRPHAYKYRDYVLRSFNTDKPFDTFIQEQLAGDEMVSPPYTNLRPDDVEKLTATGFLRMAPDGTGISGVDESLARNQVIADSLRIVTSSLMGLTVGCAQCHHHRHDPISQQDYYRLRALFEPAYNPKSWRVPAARQLSMQTSADRSKGQQIEAEAAKIDAERLRKQDGFIERTFEKELAKLPENLRESIRLARTTPVAKQSAEQKKLLKEHPSVNVTPGSLYLYDKKAADELKEYTAKAAGLRATKPVEEFIAALTEVPGQIPPTYLFQRGDHDQPGEQVQPGGLDILSPLKITPDPKRTTSGRRLALAQWLTNGKHPLTARVLVNRVWMHHFGKGIVNTPADFGSLGERPTHPELLDWLASEFVDSGWRLKHLHRLIVTSATYRQSSRRDADKDRIDPDNRLLSRMSVKRLEAEAIRDSLLSLSGSLNRKAFGKAVPVTTDEVGQIIVDVDNKDGAGYITGKNVLAPEEKLRRTVYVQVRRSQPLTVTEAFDAPMVEPNCESRNASTVAPQALMLMNNAFVLSQAESLAKRLGTGTDEEKVRLAWRLVYSREPTAKELSGATAFLRGQEAAFAKQPKVDAKLQALTSLCHALLSSSEFLYVD